MEEYRILFLAIIFVRGLGLSKILEIITLKIIHPKADIKQMESFIKNTKISYKGTLLALLKLFKAQQ